MLVSGAHLVRIQDANEDNSSKMNAEKARRTLPCDKIHSQRKEVTKIPPFSTEALRKKIKRRCREMKMGAQIRTGKRLPDTGKRFRDRIRAYVPHRQLLFLFVFSISIGKSFSGTDLYPHFHFQITVEPPRLIFFFELDWRLYLWCLTMHGCMVHAGGI